MQFDSIKQYVITWNDQNKDSFYEAAERIWETPELSMQEFQSSQVLMDLLSANGFEVEKGVAEMPTAFIATYGDGHPVIGINAEYDALPGLSQKKGVYEKDPILEGAPGQGCGHNLLGTAGTKAAISLKSSIDKFKLSGTIKVIGAPAEELCLGKSYLGKAGFLSGFDAFLDWHPFQYNIANYDSCAAYFSVKYHFKGRTSHGNMPWFGKSALDAAMLQAHGVEVLREHLYPGSPPSAANTINYTFTDTGPEFASVVPDRTSIWFIGRFTTTAEAQSALEQIGNCAKGAALMTGTSVEEELIAATHHKIPNKTLAEYAYRNFELVGPPLFTDEEHEIAKKLQKEVGVPEIGLPTDLRPFEGGFTPLCDTSEYSWNAPYTTFWIASSPGNIGWHNWIVNVCSVSSIGLKSMDTAAKVISLTGIDILTNPDLLEKAWAEFKERTEGEEYKCLLPDEMKPPIDMNAEIMEKYR